MTETNQIFLSYRTDDSADITGRIYEHLVQRFEGTSILRDIDTIPIGVDFRAYIDQMVGQCKILLAIIGPDWVNIKDAVEGRRMDDPGDFVRIEIESALAKEIPVIPLLVRGAAMPQEADLPGNLKELANRNSIPIRDDPDFHHDMDRLIAGLETNLLGVGKEPMPKSAPATGSLPAGSNFNLGGNIQAGQLNIGGTQSFQESVEVDMREIHLHQPQGEMVMGDKIEMSGNFQGSMVNVKSRLERVSQAISGLSGDEASKSELLKLIGDLKIALAKVPEDKARDAESVSKRVEALANEVNEEEPDKEMITMSGESLKRAAKNLADVIPMVIPIATQIVSAALKFCGV